MRPRLPVRRVRHTARVTFGNPIPRPQLFPGVFLRAINFAIQLDPTLVRGGATITASDITELKGSVLAVFASPGAPYTLTQADAVQRAAHGHDETPASIAGMLRPCAT